jgi:hypothetical protein
MFNVISVSYAKRKLIDSSSELLLNTLLMKLRCSSSLYLCKPNMKEMRNAESILVGKPVRTCFLCSGSDFLKTFLSMCVWIDLIQIRRDSEEPISICCRPAVLNLLIQFRVL